LDPDNCRSLLAGDSKAKDRLQAGSYNRTNAIRTA
jgi:hypothetical protein